MNTIRRFSTRAMLLSCSTSHVQTLPGTKNIIKLLKVGLLTLSLSLVNAAYAIDAPLMPKETHQHESHDGHGRHEDEHAVKLSTQQLSIAGIAITKLIPQRLSGEIKAPGEIVQNAYDTSLVTPRISAQVLERHARLGDTVKLGQLLVTLSSVDMAEAQGDLLVSAREWQRVRKLGRQVISEKRYIQARVAFQQAKSRVSAYGMSGTQLQDFLKSSDPAKANGRFQLLAPQKGTVLSDTFISGELVEPGTVLYTISNEAVLWVEAKLTPREAQFINLGSMAVVSSNEQQFEAIVVQVHHALDEKTRTLGVRLEVPNPDDQLHAGLFVHVSISRVNSEYGLFVPLNAVLRNPDGDWVVFVEKQKGTFEPIEVELLKTVGDLALIEGVAIGSKVVTEGAFFVQSELAKAGFDIHNH